MRSVYLHENSEWHWITCEASVAGGGSQMNTDIHRENGGNLGMEGP